jgi:hypothetical protein
VSGLTALENAQDGSVPCILSGLLSECLKRVSEPELNLSGWSGAADHSEQSRIRRHVRIQKVRVIEKIEELRSEL